MGERIVVALGGNAILKPGQRGTYDEQLANVEDTCRQIATMINDGHDVLITHGNGPQVGAILLQNEAGSDQVPPMPLDACGAESQGLIGYMIQRTLGNMLREQGTDRGVATIITQVVVSATDPAFNNPTKPIGPHYNRERATALQAEQGFQMVQTAHGWRRVVPSPAPMAIGELATIRKLVDAGTVVIASGGGGVPVLELESGKFAGVEAVIDKDLAGERLAHDVGAEVFLILTDVEQVAINFGEPTQEFLDHMTTEEAEEYLRQGQFPAGSMGPKVRAAVKFVLDGGRRAIVTSMERASDALAGRAGTVIER